ncbi:MAG: lysophospholipid acyltransferase family protein [Bacilli bacterium]|nr:lysophospholipid acyltransferase family protein [Bacilli bacterium]
MNKKNIAFDADGVLFDTELYQFKKAPKYFKKKYNMDLINENGYGVKEMFNCSDEQEKDFWTKHGINYSLFFKAIKHIAEMIQKLIAEGYKVSIITGKGGAFDKHIGKIVRFLFELSLKLNKIKIDKKDIHYCSHANSAEEKAKICEDLNIDIMVEDKKETVAELSKKIEVLCMNTKNNQDCNGENITRVYNPNDIYTEIKQRNDDNYFKQLSKEEKSELSSADLKQYYKELREYYLSLPFNKENLRKGERHFKLISTFMGTVFNLKYHPKLINKELLPKKNGYILVSNHLCNKDSKLLLTTLRNHPWHPLAKIELSKGLIGWLHNEIETVYVDRSDSRNRKEATREMSKILLNDGNILIFPEGTYNKTENNLAPFAGVGAVYLSQSLDKHIVPVTITNKYNKGQRPMARVLEPIKIGIEEDLEEANSRLRNIMNDAIEENKQIENGKQYIKTR